MFLVTLMPFTINGLGVREAFFVGFLGRLHVNPDQAFACGFLSFLTMLVPVVPGILIILIGGFRLAPQHVLSNRRGSETSDLAPPPNE